MLLEVFVKCVGIFFCVDEYKKGTQIGVSLLILDFADLWVIVQNINPHDKMVNMCTYAHTPSSPRGWPGASDGGRRHQQTEQ